MGRLALVEMTSATIKQLSERVELTDENGAVVGYFEPRSIDEYGDEPSVEELDRRERESPRYSHTEVWDKIHRGERF